MTNNHAYTQLMAFQRQTEALSLVAERLGWDQETMMPSGSAEQRGEEMAAMEGILHARRTDPRIAELEHQLFALNGQAGKGEEEEVRTRKRKTGKKKK